VGDDADVRGDRPLLRRHGDGAAAGQDHRAADPDRGAVAGMLVAVNPEHPGDPYPWPHIICASIGLAGVATWPAGAWRRGPAVPWGLRPAVAAAAVAALLTLVAWFAVELVTGSGQTGLAERVAGAAQALWPLTVVLSCSRRSRGSGRLTPVLGLKAQAASGAARSSGP
jgi:hypothetical protein